MSTLRVDQLKTLDDLVTIEVADILTSTNTGDLITEADLGSIVDPLKGASLVGHVRTEAGAVGRLLSAMLREHVNVKDFGAVGDGVTNDAPAIQAAINAAAGKVVYIPAGTYRVNTQLTYVTTASTTFTPGLKLLGDGMGRTVIDSRVASNPAIKIDTNSVSPDMFFQLDGYVHGLTITGEFGNPALGSGLSLRHAYNFRLEQVHIKTFAADGLQVVCTEGDPDASNMLSLKHVRIDTCLGWGIDSAPAGAFNEISFLRMEHVFINGCGTVAATSAPFSGGMKWKGQILVLDSCAFTTNKECALYIPGTAGTPSNVFAAGTTWENNLKRHVYGTGIKVFKANNIQFYSNDSFVTHTGLEFDGDAGLVTMIDIDNVIVRATAANNPHTAFKILGANLRPDTCRVRNVVWDNFDYTGQSRFSGFLFDPVPFQCDVVSASATQLLLRPNLTAGEGGYMPLRLRGGGGGVPSTTGEWVKTKIPSGGLTISNGGLSANTTYYVYLWDDNHTTKLEISATAPTTDASTDYKVKTGDATKLFVGRTRTNASSQFVTTAGGWTNPLLVPGSQPGVYSFVWTDATNRLMVKYASEPASDTDGTVVGTQT